MNSTAKQVVFWLVILLFGVLLWQVVKMGSNGMKEQDINFTNFMNQVNAGQVADVTINGAEVRGHLKDGKTAFHTTVPTTYTDMYKALQDKQVNVRFWIELGAAVTSYRYQRQARGKFEQAPDPAQIAVDQFCMRAQVAARVWMGKVGILQRAARNAQAIPYICDGHLGGAVLSWVWAEIRRTRLALQSRFP